MTVPPPDPTTQADRGGRSAAVMMLLAIFVAGIGAGVAVDRLLLLPHQAPPAAAQHRGGHPPPREQRQAAHDRFARALGLTPEQRVRVDSVMARQTRELRAARESLRPRVDSLLAETRRELDAILTPEQRLRLEELRRDRAFGRLPGDPSPHVRRGP